MQAQKVLINLGYEFETTRNIVSIPQIQINNEEIEDEAEQEETINESYESNGINLTNGNIM